MKVTVFSGWNNPNILAAADISQDRAITLHYHLGDCNRCEKGRCHHPSITVLMMNGSVIVVCEQMPAPLITYDEPPADEFEWPEELFERG